MRPAATSSSAITGMSGTASRSPATMIASAAWSASVTGERSSLRTTSKPRRAPRGWRHLLPAQAPRRARSVHHRPSPVIPATRCMVAIALTANRPTGRRHARRRRCVALARSDLLGDLRRFPRARLPRVCPVRPAGRRHAVRPGGPETPPTLPAPPSARARACRRSLADSPPAARDSTGCTSCSAARRRHGSPIGPHSTASTTPEWMPIVGTPSAAAMCFGPQLLPTYSAQARSSAGSWRSGVLPTSEATASRLATWPSTSSASSASSGPPINTALTAFFSTSRSISEAKCSAGHCRMTLPTPGCTATTGRSNNARASSGRNAGRLSLPASPARAACGQPRPPCRSPPPG